MAAGSRETKPVQSGRRFTIKWGPEHGWDANYYVSIPELGSTEVIETDAYDRLLAAVEEWRDAKREYQNAESPFVSPERFWKAEDALLGIVSDAGGGIVTMNGRFPMPETRRITVDYNGTRPTVCRYPNHKKDRLAIYAVNGPDRSTVACEVHLSAALYQMGGTAEVTINERATWKESVDA